MSDQPRDLDKTRISIARSLRDIEQLALDLHAQALASPNARDFPGGDALHMLGPAAVLQDWERQYEATEEAERWADDGTDRWEKRPRLDPAIYQGDDNEQPLNVLCFWTRVIREERDQPTSLAPTISREVDYLRGQLDWTCRADTYGESEWPLCFEMAGELRTLVRRMEDVLHMGERVERTEVPCINTECESKAHLVKKRARRGIDDQYACPSCELPYDQAQFLQAKVANLRSKESDKWVLATDATQALGLPVQTVRSWIGRDKVDTRWDNGRLHVWWPDIRELAEARRMEALTKPDQRPA